jgi:hypothetical protein
VATCSRCPRCDLPMKGIVAYRVPVAGGSWLEVCKDCFDFLTEIARGGPLAPPGPGRAHIPPSLDHGAGK